MSCTARAHTHIHTHTHTHTYIHIYKRWNTTVRYNSESLDDGKMETYVLKVSLQYKKENWEIMDDWYLVSEFVLPLFCSFVNTADP